LESPSATVVITTKNRKDDLRTAVASAVAQDAEPCVLVIDDGSTDGTSELIRAQFPAVRVERSETSLGYVVQRNRAARICSTPFIFSIDDDAAYSTPRVVSQTIAEFSDPRVGAVGIPFIDVRQAPTVNQRAADERQIYVLRNYIGTAHAVRRDIFLSLGGYREFIFHQGEEDDYCLRLLAAGYVVRAGLADPIHHFESPRRDFRRLDLYGRRNNILLHWWNTPMPMLVPALAMTTANGLLHGVRQRRPLRMAQGLAMGYAGIFRYWNQRRPVTAAIARLYHDLNNVADIPLSSIESQLPLVPATSDQPASSSRSAVT
jgi:GT2 family glycosyltransferase